MKTANDLSSIVETLWLRASEHLTDEELDQIAKADDEESTAACLVEYLQEVLEGTACFVMSDNENGRIGSFQSPESVSVLMLFIARTLNAVEAGMYAGRWARDMKLARSNGLGGYLSHQNRGAK